MQQATTAKRNYFLLMLFALYVVIPSHLNIKNPKILFCFCSSFVKQNYTGKMSPSHSLPIYARKVEYIPLFLVFSCEFFIIIKLVILATLVVTRTFILICDIFLQIRNQKATAVNIFLSHSIFVISLRQSFLRKFFLDLEHLTHLQKTTAFWIELLLLSWLLLS